LDIISVISWTGNTVSFWTFPLSGNNVLKAQAFNKDGKIIYEYRYAKSNFIKIEDLKWYAVSGNKYIDKND